MKTVLTREDIVLSCENTVLTHEDRGLQEVEGSKENLNMKLERAVGQLVTGQRRGQVQGKAHMSHVSG